MDKKHFHTHWALFYTFFKASTFTFAGGLAMFPAIEQDAVEKYQLLSHDEFMEYATLSQTLPGVIALNCATLVGRRAAGASGMLAAGLGAILPPFILMLIATILLKLIFQQGLVIGTLRGIRAASTALVLSAAFSLGQYNLKDTFAIIIMIAALLLVVFGKISAPLVVLLAGAAGCVYQHIRRYKEGRRSSDVS